MTCLEAQGLITPFIRNEIKYNDLEEFLHHMNTCADCREELEVYYTILTAMKQLDEDKNLSENFREELSLKLKETENKIARKRIFRTRKKFMMIFVVIMCSTAINMRYSHEIVLREEAKKSTIEQKVTFYYDGHQEELEQKMQDYAKKLQKEKEKEQQKNKPKKQTEEE